MFICTPDASSSVAGVPLEHPWSQARRGGMTYVVSSEETGV